MLLYFKFGGGFLNARLGCRVHRACRTLVCRAYRACRVHRACRTLVCRAYRVHRACRTLVCRAYRACRACSIDSVLYLSPLLDSFLFLLGLALLLSLLLLLCRLLQSFLLLLGRLLGYCLSFGLLFLVGFINWSWNISQKSIHHRSLFSLLLLSLLLFLSVLFDLGGLLLLQLHLTSDFLRLVLYFDSSLDLLSFLSCNLLLLFSLLFFLLVDCLRLGFDVFGL